MRALLLCIALIAAQHTRAQECYADGEDSIAWSSEVEGARYCAMASQRTTFRACYELCKAADMSMPCIKSNAQLQALKSMHSFQYVWIDWYQSADADKSSWSTSNHASGCTTDFIQWSDGEPNDCGGLEDCAAVGHWIGDFDMIDIGCSGFTDANANPLCVCQEGTPEVPADFETTTLPMIDADAKIDPSAPCGSSAVLSASALSALVAAIAVVAFARF